MKWSKVFIITGIVIASIIGLVVKKAYQNIERNNKVNGWNEDSKRGFINKCVEETMKYEVTKEGAEKYCNCCYEKIHIKYSPIEIATSKQDSVAPFYKECAKEIVDSLGKYSNSK